MKFRLPPNCSALSHAGNAVTVAADGSVDLDPATIVLLQPHGIWPSDEPTPVDDTFIARMSTAALTAALVARNVVIPRKANDTILRGLLRQALA